MQRFFVSPEILAGAEVRLGEGIAHQVSRVLRMRPGAEIVLLDGLGGECRVRLDGVGRDEVVGTIVERRRCEAEPACRVTVCLALLNKADKYEWALQKCTELGAARFQPVLAERCVPSPPEKGRRERWERIIREAAEQSGRCLLPPLDEAVPLAQALGKNREAGAGGSRLVLMPAPGAGETVRQALAARRSGEVDLFIGPEGGFTGAELDRAKECGVHLVSLGPRTLRAETAAVAALAVVLHESGDMQPRGDMDA